MARKYSMSSCTRRLFSKDNSVDNTLHSHDAFKTLFYDSWTLIKGLFNSFNEIFGIVHLQAED